MKKILVYWRDIPSQVMVQQGRVREKAPLSHRFQEAIDRAAMRAGKGSSDAYISEWRRETTKIDNALDMAEVVAKEVEQFESAYDKDRLVALIRAHGVDESLKNDDAAKPEHSGS